MSSTLTLAAGRDLSTIGLSAWPGRPPSPRVIQSSLHRVDGDTHGPPSGTWPATDHASYTRQPNLRLLSSCGHGGLEQPCWPALWRFRGPANGQPADKASSEQLSTLISQNGELAAGSRRQSRGKPEAGTRLTLVSWQPSSSDCLVVVYYGILTGAGFLPPYPILPDPRMTR